MTTNGKEKAEIVDAEFVDERSIVKTYQHEPRELALTPVFDLAEAKKRLKELQEFVKEYLVEDEDYGIIPGTKKPALFKSGADKLCDIYGLADKYRIINQTEDWMTGLFDYEIECVLVSKRTGQLVGSGLGSCSSYEAKYRWRDQKRKCPKCGKESIIVGKEQYGGGFVCWKKAEGCGANFAANDPAITEQTTGRTQNEDIVDTKNTVLKMAKKRCLGSNTPLLISTKCGPSRVRMDTLYQIWSNEGRGAVTIPTPQGWCEVKSMIRDERPQSVRIDLLDGSHIQCTGEHVFPTQRGEIPVHELQVGDSFIRSTIDLNTLAMERNVNPEIGWVVGFFIAEGHVDRGGVKFTMHAGETEEALRVIRLAESFGCSCDFQPRKQGKAADLTVRGPAFVGLMQQFVVGSDCYGKHLSKYSWRQGRDFLSAILAGYLAGDGHKLELHGRPQPKWILGFTGENFALADDLRCVAACLGYRINLDRGWETCEGRKFAAYKGWISSGEPKYNGKSLTEVAGISVENRRAVVYDIEIDSPHLFLLPTGIISHNSKVDAVLGATRSSALFTQDEELIPHSPVAEPPKAATPAPQPATAPPPKPQPPKAAAPAKSAGPPKASIPVSAPTKPPSPKPVMANPPPGFQAETKPPVPKEIPQKPVKTFRERGRELCSMIGCGTPNLTAFVCRTLGVDQEGMKKQKTAAIQAVVVALEMTTEKFATSDELALVGQFVKDELIDSSVKSYFTMALAKANKE